MKTEAIVMEAPGRIDVRSATLDDPGAGDVVVAVSHSGVSTGTERLLFEGRMPEFPGMGYPLVPGYEAVGTVIDRGPAATLPIGSAVFVPGARCFAGLRALFGGAAATLVVNETRVVRSDVAADDRGVLLALAATAYHALAVDRATPPDLIVGHGVVGRLLARIAVAMGFAPPVVWERDSARSGGARDYAVMTAEDDPRRDYNSIYDCTGDAGIIDAVLPRLERGGEIVLAGFYAGRVGFAFAPAFMREARLRIAAEWRPADMAGVMALIEAGRLSLDGLVTDRMAATDAGAAYARAFGDPACLKMTLDWTRA